MRRGKSVRLAFVFGMLLMAPALATTITVPPPWGYHYCAYPKDKAIVRRPVDTTLMATITASGRVTRVSLLSSSGDTVFDRAAVACVAKWRYAPLPAKERRAPREQMVRIRFSPNAL
jgi:TonB family protein